MKFLKALGRAICTLIIILAGVALFIGFVIWPALIWSSMAPMLIWLGTIVIGVLTAAFMMED